MSALPVLAATAPAAGASRASSVAQAADVTVNPSAERQTILGFGGMNHTVWISDLTAPQRDTAFGNGNGQLGFSVLRIPVHEDRVNWSREVATARRAVEHGAKVIAAPWNPPAQMVESFGGGRRLRYDMYGAYAQHLNDFNGFMSDNGVDLYAVSVQNEPDYAEDWTAWTPNEMIRFLRENAGSIGTKVIAPESFQYRKSFSDPILNDPAALANLDVLGAHLYGTQYADFPYPLFKQRGAGKELWMTEVYYPNSSDSADLWPQALDVGEHIHRALVNAEFQAYVWWYIRRSYGPMREDGQISKRGANMAHFSKFVRPGYVRIDATANPQPDVYTSAYKGGGSEVVIVAINKGTSPVTQRFTLGTNTSSTVSSWVTDATRNLAPQGGISMSNGAFTGHLPARSVTTFVTAEQPPTQPPPTTGGGCAASVSLNSWGGGFVATVRVTAGSSAVDGWTVSLTLPPGATITNAWNTQRSGDSGAVQFRNASYNGRLAAGQATEFGFQATGSGTGMTPMCAAGPADGNAGHVLDGS